MLFGDIANIQVGMVLNRNKSNLNLEEFKITTGKSFVQNSLSKGFETTELNRKEVSKYILKKGDIIIKNVEPFDVLYIREENVVYTNLVLKVEGVRVSNIDILSILKSQDFKNYLSQNAIGTSIQRINAQIIRNYKVKQINQHLNKMNFEIRKLIDLKEEEIELYNKYLLINEKGDIK